MYVITVLNYFCLTWIYQCINRFISGKASHLFHGKNFTDVPCSVDIKEIEYKWQQEGVKTEITLKPNIDRG